MKKSQLAMLSLAGLAGILTPTAHATDVEMVIDVAGVERTVVFTLDEEIAPKTSANFAKLCSEGYYDGFAFHRIIPNYIVQCGDPLTKDDSKRAEWGTGGPGYTLPAELGGKHVRGAVAAARLGDAVNPDKESSGSQFYVALRDISPLDGQYTVFGNISSGLEAFDEIAGAPADANNVPTAEIRILSTRVLEAKKPEPTPSLTAAEPMTPAPAPAPAPAPTPTPVPAPASEPDPLSEPARFTPQAEETMAVNVDRGEAAAMPRLRTDADKLATATNEMTGRQDGFVPLTEVGPAEAAAPLPSPAPLPAGSAPAPPAAFPGFNNPVPESAPAEPTESAPAPAPAPTSAWAEPDPLTPAASDPAPYQAVPPMSEDPAMATAPASEPAPAPQTATPKEPEEPRGPLGRFLRRIW